MTSRGGNDLQFAPARRRRYLRLGLHRVKGWLDPFSAGVIDHLVDRQNALGTDGGIAEIGVHHGRSFLVPYLGLRRGQLGLAIDVFEHQELNVDHSGGGNRRRFLDNVQRHARDTAPLRTIAASSLEVTPRMILDQVGRTRFFSIDGGHTEECTINDLRLAEATLVPEGIVIIDDVFNPMWPEVSVGVARYLGGPLGALVPFLITPTKVFLAGPEVAPLYRAAAFGHARARFDKEAALFGHAVDLYALAFRHPWLYSVRRLKRLLEGRPPDNLHPAMAGAAAPAPPAGATPRPREGELMER